MKKITKKRLAEQRAALALTLDAPLPDELAKQLLDIQSMLQELDGISAAEDKFKAATELMIALGLLNPKDAKRALDSAEQYR